MKLINYIIAALAAVTFAASARAAAWDLRMIQFDASNRSREVVITPAANSLLGFDANKRVVNITAGANITISGNQISAAGGGGGGASNGSAAGGGVFAATGGADVPLKFALQYFKDVPSANSPLDSTSKFVA